MAAKVKKWSLPEGDLYLGDCMELMGKLPEGSVDLVFGSPPYEDSRLYLEDGEDLNIARKTDEWVDWMIYVYIASLRACKGLVAYVVGHGKTEGFKWTAAPALLCADLHRLGINLRDPKWYMRHGVPGSGGPDDLKKMIEWVVCATHGGRLPWSKVTACGHPPVCVPGPWVSNRGKDGKRSKRLFGLRSQRKKDGTREVPSDKDRSRPLPDISNPGNVIDCGVGSNRKRTFTPQTRRKKDGSRGVPNEMDLSRPIPDVSNLGNVIDCGVGSCLGSNIGHEGEAPFPEKLAEFFIRTFCPPGGTVLDPFMGSGTTLAAAIKTGRKFIGCDLRKSQINLQLRRVKQARNRKGLGL